MCRRYGTLESCPLYRLFDRYSPLSQRRLRIAIAFDRGGHTLFETGNVPLHRLFGISVGFWFGVAFATIALWAIATRAARVFSST